MRDGTGFDDFYAATASRLTRYVYLATGDLTRAQDCVQEAYLRAWQRWGRFEASGDEEPLAWVRTVAWRLAVSDWRRATRAARALTRRGVDPDLPPPSAEVVAVRDALATLPHGQRVVLVLHYFEDLPVREIAHRLEVAEGTVKARLSRGRVALAASLRDEEEDPAWMS